jgi:pantothenate kinase type III
MPLCFGADIGNSGLRVAELDLTAGDLGSMLRINWRPVHWSPGESTTVAQRSTSAPRYLPHDATWTRELHEFLATYPTASVTAPHRWLISSVRRDALQVLQDHLGTAGHNLVEVIDYTSLPLALNVDFPARVGIDRLLAALAASQLSDSRPAIVIQAGSAVTVDLISAPPSTTAATSPQLATFEGGAIIPGVPMMLRLLGQGADLLPEIDADDLLHMPHLPGKNTEAAMICGAASALVGGVAHLVSSYRTQYGSHVPVILSGGDGMRLSPHVPAPKIQRPHLVHYGLLKLAQMRPTG